MKSPLIYENCEDEITNAQHVHEVTNMNAVCETVSVLRHMSLSCLGAQKSFNENLERQNLPPLIGPVGFELQILSPC